MESGGEMRVLIMTDMEGVAGVVNSIYAGDVAL